LGKPLDTGQFGPVSCEQSLQSCEKSHSLYHEQLWSAPHEMKLPIAHGLTFAAHAASDVTPEK